MILHILKQRDYNHAIQTGKYAPTSLQEEGFIHCSTKDQVIGVANSIYRLESDLLIMVIDSSKVQAEIVYEDLYDLGKDYPHIYGELNMDACIGVHTFEADDDGYFTLPEDLK